MDVVACVQAAKNGDQSAFASIVAEFQRPVFSLCYRMLGNRNDAEDAAQEAFLRAYRALNRYDSRRPFSSWLLSIAAHHCIDRLRRKRLNAVSLDDLPPWKWIPGTAVDPEESASRSDQSDRVGALVQMLPEDYRIVLILRYWHDLGYAEIAELLGDTESAVKSRLHRARRQMAEALDGTRDQGRTLRSHGTETTTASKEQGGMTWTATMPV